MTSQDFINDKDSYNPEYPTISIGDTKDAMIEFAQYHVKKALEAAKDSLFLDRYGDPYEVMDAMRKEIDNCYPKKNIV